MSFQNQPNALVANIRHSYAKLPASIFFMNLHMLVVRNQSFCRKKITFCCFSVYLVSHSRQTFFLLYSSVDFLWHHNLQTWSWWSLIAEHHERRRGKGLVKMIILCWESWWDGISLFDFMHSIPLSQIRLTRKKHVELVGGSSLIKKILNARLADFYFIVHLPDLHAYDVMRA